MADVIYPTYKTVSMTPGLDLVAGSTLKACLVSTTTGATNYVYSAAHQFFSAVPSASIVAAGVALSGKAAPIGTPGTLTASPVVWPSVALVGSTHGEAIIIYNDTGAPDTSQLVAYLDTETGLPVTPNGANITLTWSGNVLTLS